MYKLTLSCVPSATKAFLSDPLLDFCQGAVLVPSCQTRCWGKRCSTETAAGEPRGGDEKERGHSLLPRPIAFTTGFKGKSPATKLDEFSEILQGGGGSIVEGLSKCKVLPYP